MNDILETVRDVLTDARFAVRQLQPMTGPSGSMHCAIAFESDTVIGFVLAYNTVAALVEGWRAASETLVGSQSELLGAAGPKAWNTYLVLLSHDDANFGEALALGQIEEDLEGMRKIARAGVRGPAATESALLPLLPFRAAPVLEPINMAAEITDRAGELSPEIVRAFLSGADQAVVLQIVEDNA
jgi:hypothetical protein